MWTIVSIFHLFVIEFLIGQNVLNKLEVLVKLNKKKKKWLINKRFIRIYLFNFGECNLSLTTNTII